MHTLTAYLRRFSRYMPSVQCHCTVLLLREVSLLGMPQVVLPKIVAVPPQTELWLGFATS